MAPERGDLPPLRRYHVTDASLVWASDRSGALKVRGFKHELHGAYTARKRGLMGSAVGWLTGSGKARLPRSLANPSELAGEEVTDEEGILHLKQLPSFNGRISPMEAEWLLQVLTVPYLRIPLLLSFFAAQHRVPVLAEASIQAMLDAALFEPGDWHPDAPRPPPASIPAPGRSSFATPAGLLLNELQCAPTPLLAHLLELARNALDLDMGRYKPLQGRYRQGGAGGAARARGWLGGRSSSGLGGGGSGAAGGGARGGSLALLYVLRLLVRIEGFVILLLGAGSAPSGSAEAGADPAARGTYTTDPTRRAALRKVLRALRSLLWDRFYPVVEHWCDAALTERDSPSACVLLAHLALLCRHSTALDFQRVSTVLVAKAYLHNFYPWDVDAAPAGSAKGSAKGSGVAAADESLLVPQTELLSLFQALRRPISTWLQANPSLASEAFEAVERVLSHEGRRRRSPSDGVARQWIRLREGMYMPDTGERDG